MALSILILQKKSSIVFQNKIHSIEQPIAKNQIENLKVLCETSPIPIALDEELIGVNDFESKLKLIDFVKPHYLVLKPSLLGGFKSCDEWIEIAEKIMFRGGLHQLSNRTSG